MALTDGSGLSATDIMALTGNNEGFGNGSFGWWIILFILLLGGGFGGGFGSNAGNTGYIASDVQRGFDQSAVITALGNLNNAVTSGFANASVDSCNKAMANMQAINGVQMQMSNDKFDTISTLNNGHNAILNQMGAYEMARQQCCCDNKLAVANLQSTLLAEHCSDRNEIDRAMMALSNQMNAGFQALDNKIDQIRYDDLKAKYDAVIQERNFANVVGLVNGQTQQLFANNQAQTDTIMNYLNPPYARAYPPTTGTT